MSVARKEQLGLPGVAREASPAAGVVRYPRHEPSDGACGRPLVPPVVAGRRDAPAETLACAAHGLVPATPPQVAQAEAAARADGTWAVATQTEARARVERFVRARRERMAPPHDAATLLTAASTNRVLVEIEDAVLTQARQERVRGDGAGTLAERLRAQVARHEMAARALRLAVRAAEGAPVEDLAAAPLDIVTPVVAATAAYLAAERAWLEAQPTPARLSVAPNAAALAEALDEARAALVGACVVAYRAASGDGAR